ncbi:MAG: hypothetical protein EOP83_02885 [Verrucomicrobiaceae bacterium]|nr:MAG: hypothetical protein EOP83_02885 [Verrucomicrobiaceae bacterium]
MDSDTAPPILVNVLRIAAFICAFVAVLLVLGSIERPAEIASANFTHAFMCLGALIGFLWMAKVLELLHEIATKKSTPPVGPVAVPAPAPVTATEV